MNIIKATYSQGKVIFSNGKEIKMDEDFIKGHDEFYHHQRAQVEEKIAKLNKEAQDATPKALVKINASIEALNKEKTSYENSLTSPHEIAFGIRPEDIHEINEENEAKYASSDAKFDLEVSVAELLGHEYYIHADFAGVDLISKVPTTKVIKLHDHIQVAFDLKKAHCFDVVSTSRIY
jgi:ABC-type sugar transport system ATPase subunit